MKNIIFTDRIKYLLGKECDSVEGQQAEIQTEGIKSEATDSKLDFQFFDIDDVFAN
jgi:hypothetical protein